MGGCKPNRAGFTLIELLVVIAIMALLAGLTIAFLPSAASSARESRAAASLQGYLNIAKQRALRDQAPRGLRLKITNASTAAAPATLDAWNNGQTYNVFDGVSYNGLSFICVQANTNTAPNYTPPGPPLDSAFWIQWRVATECQYLETPDDFTGGTILSGSAVVPNDTIVVSFGPTLGDLVNGYYTPPNVLNPAEAPLWAVQPGDYLEVMGSGLMHQIVGLVDPWTVRISPPLAYSITVATPNYRIVRAPRPVGDEVLKLPTDTIVDFSTNALYANPQPIFPYGDTYFDIVFGPTGAVITRGVATPNIHLWVRSPEANVPGNFFKGDPSIVSIYTRTGFVGFSRPEQTSGNPYALVQ